jgi:arylsulfatase
MTAEVEIPAGGAEGPIAALGGDTAGWSLYLKDGRPVYCYNLAALEYTYLRGEQPLTSGRHTVRYEFEKQGQGQYGAGGIGRLFVDGQPVAEGEIPRTMAFAYSADETFDVGCDKGAPVTPEYPALAAFTGRVIRVDFDLKPDLHHEPEKHAEAMVTHAMIRQ